MMWFPELFNRFDEYSKAHGGLQNATVCQVPSLPKSFFFFRHQSHKILRIKILKNNNNDNNNNNNNKKFSAFIFFRWQNT